MPILKQLQASIHKWMSPVTGTTGRLSSGWWAVVRESLSGAWQRNTEVAVEDALSTPAIYACTTLISNDVGKLRQRLVEFNYEDGIWVEITAESPYHQVLRRPNRYQNQIQFKQWWIMSKLRNGNAYALKQRDQRGIVIALYLLDPTRVLPLVTNDGSVYYQLGQDNLSGLRGASVVVPASEIIHDRMNCLYHPLVGISPLYAAAIAAGINIAITRNTLRFHANGAMPGGIIYAPGNLEEGEANSLAAKWQSGFTDANAGKVAVLADGLKYEALSQKAVDSQLIETLKWSDERICSVFHVPAHKIGAGTAPQQLNFESLQQQYYSDCLQSLIEEYEAVMDDGLGLADKTVNGKRLGVDLDVDGLLRMDSKTLIDVVGAGVDKAILKTDEARRRLNLGKVPGGDTIWRQQQYYSLEQLNARTGPAPGNSGDGIPTTTPPPDDPEDDDAQERAMRGFEEMTA